MADTAEQVLSQWEQLKTRETDGNKRVLSGVPQTLPSMIKAYRIQEKAHGVGFDWEEPQQVWNKVREEIAEFEQEVASRDADRLAREFGDLIFSLINAARLYGINPDNALELTNRKFINRFNYLEDHTLSQGRQLSDMTLQEMEQLWQESKRLY